MQAFETIRRLPLTLFRQLRRGGRVGFQPTPRHLATFSPTRVLLAVTAVILVGVGLSAWIAQQSAIDAGHHSRAEFVLKAAQIDANIELIVQRETDLLHAAASFMQDHPNDFALGFRHWAADLGVLSRYPELVSLSTIQPAAAPTRGCPEVMTAGSRLTALMLSIGTANLCRSMRDLTVTRDSGRLTPFGFSFSPAMRLYGEVLPVYRTARTPTTRAARRQEFLGWTVVTAYPQMLLRAAVRGFPNMSLAIRPMAVDRLTFSTGPRIPGARLRTTLPNGTIEWISGSVQSTSVLDDSMAVQILLGGSALSFLIGLVVLLLGTSRERAMRLVTQMTDQIAHQALHDGLTGLPNRMLLVDRTEHALVRAERRNAPLAVLFVDVDGFSGVNDSLGHDAGDEVLRTLGARISGVIRNSDTVGRLGSDEFAVLLEAQASSTQPEVISQRILEVLGKPVELEDGTEVAVTASIGIARGRAETAEELLRRAHMALFAAKDSGKNRYVTFTQEMQLEFLGRQALEFELRNAMVNGELFLVYQPTFHLDDGTLRGAEALLRWRHPARGIVSPDQFIPVAEESGLIVDIGRWVAEEACRQAAIWQGQGIQMVMAINVSGRQLDDPDFDADIERILNETGLEPASLVLEVTETALMRDPRAAAASLTQLKRLGVRIAIDDFGTGYSSLAYLRQLPVDALKIDRSFVSAIGSSQDALALVTTMVQLGKRLHITTLGEGIEEEVQLERLRGVGCELGQGYFFARPVSAEEFDRMLSDGTLKPAPVASRILAWAAHLRQTKVDPDSGSESPADAELVGSTPGRSLDEPH